MAGIAVGQDTEQKYCIGSRRYVLRLGEALYEEERDTRSNGQGYLIDLCVFWLYVSDANVVSSLPCLVMLVESHPRCFDEAD